MGCHWCIDEKIILAFGYVALVRNVPEGTVINCPRCNE